MLKATVKDFRMSGGPIRGFRKGWALIPFHGEKAHYWKAIKIKASGHGDLIEYRSACGTTADAREGVTDALEPGTWPRCSRCIAAWNREKVR